MTKPDSTHKYALHSLETLYTVLCKTVREMSDAIEAQDHKKFKQKKCEVSTIRAVISKKKKNEKARDFLGFV